MALKIGNITPSKLYLGSTEIQKAYLGSNLVWDKTASFLLDTYPAFYGISNRQLKTGVTDVVNVRESGSNTEAGFTPTEITDGTLTTFTGSNDGLVVEPIDQSGNSFVVEQSVANDQPLIVDNGTLVTSGVKPAWDNTNAKGWNSSANLDLSDASEVWFFCVVNYTNGSINQFILDHAVPGINNNRTIVAFADALNTFNVNMSSDSGSVSTNSYNLPANGRVLISVRMRAISDAVYSEVYYNGVQQTIASNTGASQRAFGNNRFFCLVSSNDDKGVTNKAQEFIIYKGDQSSNRAAIETNINNHYSIY